MLSHSGNYPRDQGNNRGYHNSYDNRRGGDDFSRNYDRPPPNRDYNRRDGGFMSRDRGGERGGERGGDRGGERDNNRFDYRVSIQIHNKLTTHLCPTFLAIKLASNKSQCFCFHFINKRIVWNGMMITMREVLSGIIQITLEIVQIMAVDQMETQIIVTIAIMIASTEMIVLNVLNALSAMIALNATIAIEWIYRRIE